MGRFSINTFRLRDKAAIVLVVAALSGIPTGCKSQSKPAATPSHLEALAHRLEADRRLFEVALGIVEAPPQGFVMEAKEYGSAAERRVAESRRDALTPAYYFVQDLSDGRTRPQPFIYSCVLRPAGEVYPRSNPSLAEKYQQVLDVEWLNHLTTPPGESDSQNRVITLELAAGEDRQTIVELRLPHDFDDMEHQGRHIWWLAFSEENGDSNSESNTEVLMLPKKHRDAGVALYIRLTTAAGEASEWREIEIFPETPGTQSD